MSQILIADDHSIVRIGTKILIKELLGDKTKIVEVATFAQALEKISMQNFDLILLDINLPGGNNLEMIELIKIRDINIKILIFSSYDESIFAIKYIQAGANGYLNKESGQDQFKKALLTILQGKSFISDHLKEIMFSELLENKSDGQSLIALSNRELEVAQLLIKGLSTSQVAETLQIKTNTVSTFKAHIYSKLGINNIVDLIEKIKLIS